MKVVVIGDIHGQFGDLNDFINKDQPDIIIQAGDNAYYWKNDTENIGAIKPQNTKVYLVPGNHENWDMFEELVGRHGKHPVEIEPNIFMCPIGSTLEVNGQTILFVGGADSIDKAYRIWKKSWWEQEILTYDDFKYIEANVKKVDIVVSHTCPEYFTMHKWSMTDKLRDPSRQILNFVYEKYLPKLWYFGHWHQFQYGRYYNCDWVGLNMIGETNWYKYLII